MNTETRLGAIAREELSLRALRVPLLLPSKASAVLLQNVI
jgi:hypothetical protein